MSGVIGDILRGYLEQIGQKQGGPTWRQDRALKDIAVEREGAELASMPSPEEMQAERAARVRASDALTGYRGAQEESLGDKGEIARATLQLKSAESEYQRDPGNPKNALMVAQMKKALADATRSQAAAGYDTARTAAPERFRSQPSSSGGTLLPYIVNMGGKPTLINRRTGQPIEGMEPGDTADMRNKVAGRQLAKVSINAVKELSQNVITKIGPAQRLEAMARGVDAVFGNDPEFRTYQDARMGLAGNLAVAQQGSRPSDADIKAIWLPLVPDAYRDSRDSAVMKWNLINTMMGTNRDAGEEGAGGGDENTGNEPVVPEGESRTINGVVYDKVPGGWQRRK